ncbi:MAG: hypothetical protein AAGE84_04755 [Cyanobacteria bacterium P01_G01_bin.39]
MRIRKFIAACSIGLIINVSIPRSIRSAPVPFFWGAIKIGGFIIAATSLWVAMEQATMAEHDSATESLIKHLEDSPEFPIKGLCKSPGIKSGEVQEGWIVSIDDKKYLHSFIESEFCQSGGVSKDGKYIIGVFVSQYHANNFAKVVKYRTDNDIGVYVSSKPSEITAEE